MAKRISSRPGKAQARVRLARAPRRLVIEGLEVRDLMAVLFANHLDDVRLDASGVSVDPPNQSPDPAGYVLIVQGGSRNDSISIGPSASAPAAPASGVRPAIAVSNGSPHSSAPCTSTRPGARPP